MSLTKEERRAQFNKVLFTSLQGGERSCACLASYKCGEGVHPVRVEYIPQNPIAERILTCPGGGYNSLLAGYRGDATCKYTPNRALCHPEPDSGSIHSVENVINRFRVKHGMTPNVDIFPLHGGGLGWGLSRKGGKAYTSNLVAMTTSQKGGCKRGKYNELVGLLTNLEVRCKICYQ